MDVPLGPCRAMEDELCLWNPSQLFSHVPKFSCEFLMWLNSSSEAVKVTSWPRPVWETLETRPWDPFDHCDAEKSSGFIHSCVSDSDPQVQAFESTFLQRPAAFSTHLLFTECDVTKPDTSSIRAGEQTLVVSDTNCKWWKHQRQTGRVPSLSCRTSSLNLHEQTRREMTQIQFTFKFYAEEMNLHFSERFPFIEIYLHGTDSHSENTKKTIEDNDFLSAAHVPL